MRIQIETLQSSLGKLFKIVPSKDQINVSVQFDILFSTKNAFWRQY